jgi:hypothetical protein
MKRDSSSEGSELGGRDFPLSDQEHDTSGHFRKLVEYQPKTSSRISEAFKLICRNAWFERFFLFASICHNVYMIARTGSDSLKPGSQFVDIGFALLYLLQTIMVATSGQLVAYLKENIYNRLDFVAMLTAWIQVIARSGGMTFTLCSLRLLRLMQPLTVYRPFSVLDAILQTLNRGWALIASIVTILIITVVMFGIVGVYGFSESFRRRCVWADNLQIKIPEQYCTRYEGNSYMDQPHGLNNNCGPLQLCLDVGNPNSGLTHFDHLGGLFVRFFFSLTNPATLRKS